MGGSKHPKQNEQETPESIAPELKACSYQSKAEHWGQEVGDAISPREGKISLTKGSLNRNLLFMRASQGSKFVWCGY